MSLSRCTLLREKPRELLSSRPKLSNVIEQLNNYISAPRATFHTDPLEFWATSPQTVIRQIALKFLVIPATSVPSEVTFSAAGNIQTVRRNRLTPHHLEQLLFLNKNINYINFNNINL